MILRGDSLERLKEFPDNYFDAVVTDPPYGLKFMGKKWDYNVPSVDLWSGVLRVLKPGGHLLSFGGTRTYHRMVVAIEDAGFEVRDQLQWIYGSGFPKSLDVSKAIDKAAGAERDYTPTLNMQKKGEVGEISKNRRCAQCGKARASGNPCVCPRLENIPATDDAKRWSGWSTALKPANEPIVLARKPLEKGLTVAQNVLKWGTGAINVDASRIGYEAGGTQATNPSLRVTNGKPVASHDDSFVAGLGGSTRMAQAQGRWPANVLFDEEAAAALDEQTKDLHGAGHARPAKRKCAPTGNIILKRAGDGHRLGDSGGASRFFYVAKASKRERNEGLGDLTPKESGVKNDSGRGFSESDPYKKVLNQNHHPTVKPVKLMEYLCKLITPSSGVILDPFCGSGSTGVAAVRLDFGFVGVEMSEEYAQIAERRVSGGD